MADDLERIAAEKAAVTALRGSTKAIETVLARNTELERALKIAGDNLRGAKRYVGTGCYANTPGDQKRLVQDVLEEQAQAALKLVA